MESMRPCTWSNQWVGTVRGKEGRWFGDVEGGREREEMGPSVFFYKCSLIDDSV
jgi:hypothetical protein